MVLPSMVTTCLVTDFSSKGIDNESFNAFWAHNDGEQNAMLIISEKASVIFFIQFVCCIKYTIYLMDCKKFMGTTNTTYNRLDPLDKGGY